MRTLYTFGYLSTKGERIIKELITLQTPNVDIRFNPTSRNFRYTQEAFKNREGIIYYHIVELGNELYKEALSGKFDEPHIKIADLDTGLVKLEEILDRHGRAAIFCACGNKKTCHRIKVAALAKEKLGLTVVHL